jgi:hypothetical protein
MRFVKSLILGTALLASIPGAAQAQDRRFHFNISFGPTFIAGELGNRFSTGLGPAVGVTYDINDRIGIQVEYAFRRFHAENYIGLFTAHHDTHQIDANLIFNLTPRTSSVRVYLAAGGGAYYRQLTITEYLGSAIGCDPYWYICGSVPITDVVGSRGGWDGGVTFGGGVGFKMGDDGEFFVESKYHYVIGPTFADGTRVDGHYIPLSFGFRF